MSGDDRIAAGLTRALVIGVAVGSTGLTQVGCAPTAQTAGTATAQGVSAAAFATEQELCQRVLTSRSAHDAEVLLQRYPGGACVPEALSALTPEVLATISTASLQGVPPAVRAQIPQEIQRHLRFGAPAQPATVQPGSPPPGWSDGGNGGGRAPGYTG